MRPEAIFENACCEVFLTQKGVESSWKRFWREKRADAAMAVPKRLAGSGRRKLTVELFENPAQPIDLGLIKECM